MHWNIKIIIYLSSSDTRMECLTCVIQVWETRTHTFNFNLKCRCYILQHKGKVKYLDVHTGWYTISNVHVNEFWWQFNRCCKPVHNFHWVETHFHVDKHCKVSVSINKQIEIKKIIVTGYKLKDRRHMR